MRPALLAVVVVALSSFLVAAPPAWSAAPKARQTVQPGVYKVAIRLHADVRPEIKVWVIKA